MSVTIICNTSTGSSLYPSSPVWCWPDHSDFSYTNLAASVQLYLCSFPTLFHSASDFCWYECKKCRLDPFQCDRHVGDSVQYNLGIQMFDEMLMQGAFDQLRSIQEGIVLCPSARSGHDHRRCRRVELRSTGSANHLHDLSLRILLISTHHVMLGGFDYHEMSRKVDTHR